jgi:Tol biopolymer transport system component
MTTPARLERELPSILADLAIGSAPAYIDDILWQTEHTSQARHRMSPERWSLMTELVRERVATPRIPWRAVGIALAAVALLIALASIYVGSQPRLPEPFGLARNGLIIYSTTDGDIATLDPTSGISTPIVTGPDVDADPIWAPDGTRFVFTRKAPGDPAARLVVARADGSDSTVVTRDPPKGLDAYGFTPDGRSIYFVSAPTFLPTISMVGVGGGDIRTFDLGVAVVGRPQFKPPNGDDILFVGAAGTDGSYGGLYLVRPDGSDKRTVIEPESDGQFLDDPVWSPDGTRIAYSRMMAAEHQYRLHVMTADLSNDTVVGLRERDRFDGWPVWSPDSSRILITRANTDDTVQALVLAPDDPNVAVPIGSPWPGWWIPTADWAPDGTTILARPKDPDGNPLPEQFWDPRSGSVSPVPGNPTSDPSWQRLAP